MNSLRDLGLFDPAILIVVSAITVISFVALRLTPKAALKRPGTKPTKAIRSSGLVKASRRLKSHVVNTAGHIDRHQMSTSAVNAAPSQLEKLSAIIKAGAAQSLRVSSAHASAAIKINAAEHSLGRALQEMQALTVARPEVSVVQSTLALAGLSDAALSQTRIAA
jgi:hypothetical protein